MYIKTLFLKSRRLLSTNITMLQYRLMIQTGSAVIIRNLNTKQEQLKMMEGILFLGVPYQGGEVLTDRMIFRSVNRPEDI